MFQTSSAISTATPSNKIKSFDEIDQKICDEIDKLTSEDNTLWTSPEHNRREYVHRFFQYPAMMVPVVQKRIIGVILKHNPHIKNVLDPYVGSGTSLVACMENGLECYGQDINPLAIILSKTRTGPYYFAAIEKKKVDLFDKILKDKSNKLEVNFIGITKWFKSEIVIELSKIVRAIKKEKRLAIRRFYWVLLAETIRMTSNDRTSTFKLHVRPEGEIKNRNISAIEFFQKHFDKCLDDIKEYAELLAKANQLTKGTYKSKVKVRLQDSKYKIYVPSNIKNYSMLVSSPPYGDNQTTITYGQHSYLPLQWIDTEDFGIRNKADYLKTMTEIDKTAIGGKKLKLDDKELNKIFNKSVSLKETYDSIALKDDSKKEKVVNFFYELNQSLEIIYDALSVNSYQIWTIGNRNVAGIEIPNNKILTELIQDKKAKLIKVVSRNIINKRMASRNNSTKLMSAEDILILRKTV